MNMVEWKKLGEVCEIKGRIGFRGYTRDDQVEKGEGAISLSPGNIDNGSMNYESCTYITWDKYEESPEIIVNEGDIILCKTASVGKVARIHHLPEKATINPQLVLIKNIQTNPQYLFYVLDDKPFQSKIKGLAGIGSVPNVSQAKLSAIEIPIPSLFEQIRIVGILDTFTASIDNLKEQIAQRRKQYEYYRDQLLDLEGKPGVEMKTLGEICLKLTDGSHFSPQSVDHGYFMPSVKDMTNRGFVYADCKQISKKDYESLIKSGCKPKVNDVLIAKDGSMLKYAFPVIKEEEIVVLSSIAILTPRTNLIKSAYLAHYLKRTNVKEKTIREFSSKGGVPRIILKNFKKIGICVPSLQEQQRIVSILDTFESSIQNLEALLKQREKQYEYYRNKLLTFE